MQRQTTMIKPDQIERKWYVIDAKENFRTSASSVTNFNR